MQSKLVLQSPAVVGAFLLELCASTHFRWASASQVPLVWWKEPRQQEFMSGSFQSQCLAAHALSSALPHLLEPFLPVPHPHGPALCSTAPAVSSAAPPAADGAFFRARKRKKGSWILLFPFCQGSKTEGFSSLLCLSFESWFVLKIAFWLLVMAECGEAFFWVLGSNGRTQKWHSCIK